jgi:hypothetical protein
MEEIVKWRNEREGKKNGGYQKLGKKKFRGKQRQWKPWVRKEWL